MHVLILVTNKTKGKMKKKYYKNACFNICHK